MDPNSGGRQKKVTDNSKGVHRRGEGLGTGPVGRHMDYVVLSGSTEKVRSVSCSFFRVIDGAGSHRNWNRR